MLTPGVLLFEMLHNRSPYPGRRVEDVKRKIKIGKITFKRGLEAPVKELLLRMLEQDPAKRCTFEEIKNHEIMKEFFVNEELPQNLRKENFDTSKKPFFGTQRIIKNGNFRRNKHKHSLSEHMSREMQGNQTNQQYLPEEGQINLQKQDFTKKGKFQQTKKSNSKKASGINLKQNGLNIEELRDQARRILTRPEPQAKRKANLYKKNKTQKHNGDPRPIKRKGSWNVLNGPKPGVKENTAREIGKISASKNVQSPEHYKRRKIQRNNSNHVALANLRTLEVPYRLDNPHNSENEQEEDDDEFLAQYKSESRQPPKYKTLPVKYTDIPLEDNQGNQRKGQVRQNPKRRNLDLRNLHKRSRNENFETVKKKGFKKLDDFWETYVGRKEKGKVHKSAIVSPNSSQNKASNKQQRNQIQIRIQNKTGNINLKNGHQIKHEENHLRQFKETVNGNKHQILRSDSSLGQGDQKVNTRKLYGRKGKQSIEIDPNLRRQLSMDLESERPGKGLQMRGILHHKYKGKLQTALYEGQTQPFNHQIEPKGKFPEQRAHKRKNNLENYRKSRWKLGKWVEAGVIIERSTKKENNTKPQKPNLQDTKNQKKKTILFKKVPKNKNKIKIKNNLKNKTKTSHRNRKKVTPVKMKKGKMVQSQSQIFEIANQFINISVPQFSRTGQDFTILNKKIADSKMLMSQNEIDSNNYTSITENIQNHQGLYESPLRFDPIAEQPNFSKKLVRNQNPNNLKNPKQTGIFNRNGSKLEISKIQTKKAPKKSGGLYLSSSTTGIPLKSSTVRKERSRSRLKRKKIKTKAKAKAKTKTKNDTKEEPKKISKRKSDSKKLKTGHNKSRDSKNNNNSGKGESGLFEDYEPFQKDHRSEIGQIDFFKYGLKARKKMLKGDKNRANSPISKRHPKITLKSGKKSVNPSQQSCLPDRAKHDTNKGSPYNNNADTEIYAKVVETSQKIINTGNIVKRKNNLRMGSWRRNFNISIDLGKPENIRSRVRVISVEYKKQNRRVLNMPLKTSPFNNSNAGSQNKIKNINESENEKRNDHTRKGELEANLDQNEMVYQIYKRSNETLPESQKSRISKNSNPPKAQNNHSEMTRNETFKNRNEYHGASRERLIRAISKEKIGSKRNISRDPSKDKIHLNHLQRLLSKRKMVRAPSNMKINRIVSTGRDLEIVKLVQRERGHIKNGKRHLKSREDLSNNEHYHNQENDGGTKRGNGCSRTNRFDNYVAASAPRFRAPRQSPSPQTFRSKLWGERRFTDPRQSPEQDCNPHQSQQNTVNNIYNSDYAQRQSRLKSHRLKAENTKHIHSKKEINGSHNEEFENPRRGISKTQKMMKLSEHSRGTIPSNNSEPGLQKRRVVSAFPSPGQARDPDLLTSPRTKRPFNDSIQPPKHDINPYNLLKTETSKDTNNRKQKQFKAYLKKEKNLSLSQQVHKNKMMKYKRGPLILLNHQARKSSPLKEVAREVTLKMSTSHARLGVPKHGVVEPFRKEMVRPVNSEYCKGANCI